MTRCRNVIILAVTILVLAVGAFVWPGFLTTTDSSSTASPATIVDGRGETAQDETDMRMKRHTFRKVMAEDRAFYNCTANDDEVKRTEWPNVKRLIPCGTDIVEVIKIDDAAENVPQIIQHAGNGGDNLVTTRHDMVNVDGIETPMWTMTWSVGEGSTFLQQYVQYRRVDGQLSWTPVVQHAASTSTGEFSYTLAEDIVSVGLVFTDGTSGTPVPIDWWRVSNLWWR